MVDQHSARLDISSRERNRLMGVGIPGLPEPFTPDSLPPEQYERWGETTLETRAREVIRRPTRAEITQEGSEFRSDLLPHNYRSHYLFIPDTFLIGDIGKTIDVQTDFQVWACVISCRAKPGFPTGKFMVEPMGMDSPNSGAFWWNFSSGLKFSYTITSQAGPADPATGWFVSLFDRWITEPGGYFG